MGDIAKGKMHENKEKKYGNIQNSFF